MAVIKAVPKPGKSAGRAIDYAAKDVGRGGLFSGVNCSDDPKEAAQDFANTKEVWGQTDGRQYKHYAQSWPPGEVTVEQAHEISRLTAEKYFPGHESAVGTHIGPAGIIHGHIVVNSVNYENGKKLQESPRDLENMKAISDDYCRERGLSVIDRSQPPERGAVRAYNQEKYQTLKKGFAGEKEVRLLDAAAAVREVSKTAKSREDFKNQMAERGYKTQYDDQHKNIVYTDKDGNKIRAANLEKTFSDPELGRGGIEDKIRENAKQLDQDRGQQTPPQQQRPEPERPATEPAREQQPAPERTRPEPEHQAGRSTGPSMDATLQYGRDMDKTRGDQRTADERRAGVSLDPEEEARRGIGKGHDALRNLDRANESPVGQKPQPQPAQQTAPEKAAAPEQRRNERPAPAAGQQQSPPQPVSREEARQNIKAAVAARNAEEQQLDQKLAPKLAAARDEVNAEAIKRDHPAAMRERAEALDKREAAAAQERQQLAKDKPGWLSGEQKQLQHEMRERANANRMEQIAKEREQLEKDRRDPAQWDRDRLGKDQAARKEREAAARERAAAKDPTVAKDLARRDQIPAERAELGKIDQRVKDLRGPTVNADLTRSGVEKAARNPEPVKQKLDQQKSQERENTRDTGRGR